MDATSFAALLRSRHTTRSFRPDPIPEATLDAILDDARYCPSWSNTRPYCVAVATGERLERLRANYKQTYQNHVDATAAAKQGAGEAPAPDGDFEPWKPLPADLLPASREVGRALYQHMGIERGDRAGRHGAMLRNFDFFGAPVVLWIFTHKGLLPFSAQDAGILFQTLVLAAKANGVDSCPLGLLSAWRGPVQDEFEIPDDYGLMTGLALGYASDDAVNDFRAPHPPLRLLEPR